MGLFGALFGKEDIMTALNEARNTSGAVIIDVRDADEYVSAHIPGALNIPLDRIGRDIKSVAKDKETPVFTYCLTGMRSGKAVNALKKAGYSNVKNIGGINRYKGKIERGNKGTITLDEMITYDIIDGD